MVIEPTIRKIIKYLPIGEGLRIEWTGKLVDREYKREIQEQNPKCPRISDPETVQQDCVLRRV